MVHKKFYRFSARLITTLAFIFSFIPAPAFSQVAGTQQLLEKAKSIYPKIDNIKIDTLKGVPSTIRGILADNINLKNDAHVKSFLQKSAEIFKLNNQTDEFKTKNISTDEIGMTHLKLRQEYKGVPVWGAELILHSSAGNQLREVNGRFIPGLKINTSPSVSPETALEIALQDLGPAEYRWLNPEQEKILKEVYKDESRTWKPAPELVIAPLNGDFDKGEFRLVWKMTIAVDGEKLGNYEYFVDAANGAIINKFNSMHHAVGTGTSNYNGTVTIYSKWATNTYQMIDTIRSIKTYTANNMTINPGTLLTDSDNNWTTNKDAVDAHWGLGKVYDFYKFVFNRRSFDSLGAEIHASVNYLFDYGSYSDGNNAGWNGAQMLFGNGDGSQFSPLTTIDIAGHELTHAVTQYSANLIYQGESGALNEAISDIFGTAIEFYATPSKANWLIGEECYTPGTAGDALRHMNNPNLGDQPDTYLGTYWAPTANPSLFNDWGGVHTNSGVLNYAFYLMTVGGSGANDYGDPFVVSGIGLSKTRAIAYRALTVYLTASDNYSNARERFLSAVADLYGSSSAEYKSVSDAFGAVGIGVRYVAKNSFAAGTIKINGYTTTSGSNFFASENTPQTLEAIPQNYSSYNRVWNTSGNPQSVSYWLKQRPIDPAPTKIQDAPNQSYTFTASTSDFSATYIADLKRSFQITINHQTEFDGTQTNQSTVNIVEQNSGTISAPATKTIGSNIYTFASWSDGNSSNTRSITPLDHSTYTAFYKALGKSNNSNAYTNNSQRKFVRTDDGWLHNVYESMSRVWYEISGDNGATWTLANGGKPLDNGEGKLPAIDYSTKYNQSGGVLAYQTVIIYQEKVSINSMIKVKYFEKAAIDENFVYKYEYSIKSVPGVYASTNATPVIGFSHGNVFTAVWKDGTAGLLWCWYGGVNSVNGTITGPNAITGTTSNSINPTIYMKKSGTTLDKKLAWEETAADGTSSIKYGTIALSDIPANTITTPSQGNVFAKNYQPSIIELNGGARLCWIGYRSDTGEYRTVFRDAAGGQFWNFGSNVRSVNINRNTDNSYVVGWSRLSGSTYINEYTRNTSLSAIKNFVTSGKDIQINNGANFSSQYAMAFKINSSLPHQFNKSNSVGSIGKESSESTVASGRQGVISKEKAQFYFTLGDIKVNGSNIEFEEISDTLMVNNLFTMNKCFITKPFEINDNADFTYSIEHGVTASAEAAAVLNGEKTISFKVQLIEEGSDKVITEFNHIDFSESSLPANNILYDVKTENTGSKTVRLKIIADVNSDPSEYNYSITHIYSTDQVLEKSSANQETLQVTPVPTEYSLSQNYPNPFNPTTTIIYQLPKDGMVSLKIYDAIGKEVTTLVNEFKTTGSYNIQFNASNLASGVYFYKINVNDYSATKKFILMK